MVLKDKKENMILLVQNWTHLVP